MWNPADLVFCALNSLLLHLHLCLWNLCLSGPGNIYRVFNSVLLMQVQSRLFPRLSSWFRPLKNGPFCVSGHWGEDCVIMVAFTIRQPCKTRNSVMKSMHREDWFWGAREMLVRQRWDSDLCGKTVENAIIWCKWWTIGFDREMHRGPFDHDVEA